MIISYSYLITLLEKHLVILAQRNAKNDRRNIFETVNPLFPLASLTAHVKHAVLRQQPRSGQGLEKDADLTVCLTGPW